MARKLREDCASGAAFRHLNLAKASQEDVRFRTIVPYVKVLFTELHLRVQRSASSGRTARGSVRKIFGEKGSPYISEI